MDKRYDPKTVEGNIYNEWETSGAFSPDTTKDKETFTIIMPPPNANDPLHIGHAMFVTVEDIMVRFARMNGKAALWLPGADHAGIETQFLFEKKLKKKKQSRFDFDRETLYQMIWDYVQDNAGIAKEQMKRIGASADWSRFTFTLEPDIVDRVLDTFEKLHTDKLLYRDLRLVNYCTRCGTSFSELEAKHKTQKDPLLYMKYGPFTIATVRPETKFRDTALAVHPQDKRYKKYIGQSMDIPGLLGPIHMTVIADEEVDPKFGTGIMKVTPAHDFHDFELGKKHNLPVTPIIDFKGKMDFSWFIDDPKQPEKYKSRAREYHGMHVSKFRPRMIEALKQEGLIENIDETYEHNVATCYRCGTVLEPLPLPQFFVSVKPLTEKVLEAMKDKRVKIHGPGYNKILKHWLENLKDWNISRQIVWGIRIPVWYSSTENPDMIITFLDDDGASHTGTCEELQQSFLLDEIQNGLQKVNAPVDAEYVISKDSPGDEYIQETDTFDTWFSSGQWPIVTLKHHTLFEQFYPTQVMETAYDILIMWVMRMLMFGLYLTDTSPFEDVYLHGLVRDEKGQKMSKSKGNVLNPIDVVEKYGADALRMALVMSTTAGKDSNTGEEKIRGMRNFTNKIWNAARFVIMNKESRIEIRESKNKSLKATNSQLQADTASSIHATIQPSSHDKKLYKHLNATIKTVTKQLETYKIGLAAETVYQEFWHWYCDVCIEDAKNGKLSYGALREGLRTFLILLHPFVPFVTEEIWSKIKSEDDPLLIQARWPK